MGLPLLSDTERSDVSEPAQHHLGCSLAVEQTESTGSSLDLRTYNSEATTEFSSPGGALFGSGACEDQLSMEAAPRRLEPPCAVSPPCSRLRTRLAGAQAKLSVSTTRAQQGFRASLAAGGYGVGPILGRSRANRGYSVIVVTKDGKSFAAKGTDENPGTGILAVVLRSEYEILRSLEHPGIVQVEAFVEVSGGSAMVLELCAGRCLEELMPLSDVLGGKGRHVVLTQILDAVSYLHGQQVAHRDLHALNILAHAQPEPGIEGAHVVKIVDFGSARQNAEDEGCHFPGLTDLMYEILPPMQGGGDSALDVFAVGLLAAGLLVGRPLFTADVVSMGILSIPQGFLAPSEAGVRHLSCMLALNPKARHTASSCLESIPSSDRWLSG